MAPHPESPVVKVALNRPLLTSYNYHLAGGDTAVPGCRVRVNFAGANTIGVITGPGSAEEVKSQKLKKAVLLDETPVLAPDVYKMLEFASSYYHYPLGQCLCCSLPKILREGGERCYQEIPALELNPTADPEVLKKLRSAPQKELLELLKHGQIPRRELRERGIPSAVATALLKKGLIRLTSLNLPDTPWHEHQGQLLQQTPPVPSAEQQQAIDQICAATSFRTFLLNGITGSGKTEVYLRVIEQVLQQKKAVLVLVPEIALTPQTFRRFYNRFNIGVSSMHSALSDRERLDAWLDMERGKSGILIGTRSALFTPIPNLGLIVVDEEHDSSFKQTDGFRYHACSLALVRAQICGCPVILGSATPSLESFLNVRRGRFVQINLKKRTSGAGIPPSSVIDLKREPLTQGLNAGISRTLEERIGDETARGNQVLLFLNRRGFSRHLFCHYCGHVFMCPNCDNPLTIHHSPYKLICHVCGYTAAVPRFCPGCGEEALMESGIGTEQVEAFLKLRYPDILVERIDSDSITSKIRLEAKLEQVRSGRSIILIGTQILAKGHDFPDVTLVGILDMDSSLFSDDFRSMEFAAQLMVQVSGRAGRARKKGEVLIQTHHPDSQLVNLLIDPHITYERIAAMLLHIREELMLPPYTYQAFLLANSTKRELAYYFLINLASQLYQTAAEFPGLNLSPVLSDRMEKRNNRYHFHILAGAADRKMLSAFLDKVLRLVHEISSKKSDVRFAIEMDPIFMY